MKLLLDENVSDRIISRIADLFLDRDDGDQRYGVLKWSLRIAIHAAVDSPKNTIQGFWNRWSENRKNYCDRGNMDISEIAHVVKHHRKVAKLSQAELGRLAGVGKTAVFDLEHKKETIRFDVVRKILEALNITVKLGSPLFSMGDKADSPREKEET